MPRIDSVEVNGCIHAEADHGRSSLSRLYLKSSAEGQGRARVGTNERPSPRQKQRLSAAWLFPNLAPVVREGDWKRENTVEAWRVLAVAWISQNAFSEYSYFLQEIAA